MRTQINPYELKSILTNKSFNGIENLVRTFNNNKTDYNFNQLWICLEQLDNYKVDFNMFNNKGTIYYEWQLFNNKGELIKGYTINKKLTKSFNYNTYENELTY